MAFVALFLAIVFLVPAAQVRPHAFHIDLWDGKTHNPMDLHGSKSAISQDRPKNRLTLTVDDQILWNGEAIHHGHLVEILDEVQSVDPQPVVEFEPDAYASFDAAAKVLLLIQKSGAGFQIAGSAAYCQFSHGDKGWTEDRGTGGQLAILTTIFWEDSELEVYGATPENGDCKPRLIVHTPR